jgi:hypothetical protein
VVWFTERKTIGRPAICSANGREIARSAASRNPEGQGTHCQRQAGVPWNWLHRSLQTPNLCIGCCRTWQPCRRNPSPQHLPCGYSTAHWASCMGNSAVRETKPSRLKVFHHR